MQISEPMVGLVKYEGSKFPFIYEKNILRLMPPTVEEWQRKQREVFNYFIQSKNDCNPDKWIGRINLYGKVSNGNDVVFNVEELYANEYGFVSYNVRYCFEYRQKFVTPDSIQGIMVTGREVDYFFSPDRVFDLHMPFDGIGECPANINVILKRSAEIGTYQFHGTEIRVEADAKIHDQAEIPLTAKSGLRFMFSKPEKLDFVVDVVKHCILFLRFVCGRTNIQLDDVRVYGIREGRYDLEGVVRRCSERNIEEPYKKKNRVIKYEYLREKSAAILSAIAEGKMYLDNLCPCIADTMSFGIHRIILNFVAFEREFENLYDVPIVRSKEYAEIKDLVLKFLEELRASNTGRKKEYVKSFIHVLKRTEIKYADRMKKAFSNCEEILLPFLRQDYGDIYTTEEMDHICNRMNKLRNDAVHGNLDLKLEPIHISDFRTLENLTYAMRLKHIGIEKLDIQKAIYDLKGYSIGTTASEFIRSGGAPA